MGLLFFALKRLASAIVVLFAVSVLTFLMFFAIPGGKPADRIAGRTATPEDIENVSHLFGFDKPLYVQYGRLMNQIFTGQITSYTTRLNVLDQIKQGLGPTLSLAIGAAVVWLVVGIIFGIIGALRAGKASDVAITTFNFVGISTPSFVVGSLLSYLLAFKLHVFPLGGYTSITDNPLFWFEHMIMPWFTLALLYIGVYAQVLRSGILDAMTADNVRTAQAKGLSKRRVMVRHVLRVSLIPIVSLWGLDFAGVLGGTTIIVENVFNLHGIGQYVADSIGNLDIPPVVTVTIFGAFVVVFMNAVVDILYAVLDPRIRAASS